LNKNFNQWQKSKEITESTSGSFLDIPQKVGDIVYFGIHNLSKYYRENNKLPKIDLYEIFSKKGEISKIDPAGSSVTISMDCVPREYGYRKLENGSCNSRKYMSAGSLSKFSIKVPISYLTDISHMLDGDISIFLIIDGETNYQKKLLKIIKNKEINKSKNKTFNPLTRNYDPYEGENLHIKDLDEKEEELHLCNFDPSFLSHSRGWSRFSKDKKYNYYKKDFY
jgi:hypothetical protein